MRSVEERLLEYRRTHKQAGEFRDDVFSANGQDVYIYGYKIVELILGTSNGINF